MNIKAKLKTLIMIMRTVSRFTLVCHEKALYFMCTFIIMHNVAKKEAASLIGRVHGMACRQRIF